MITLLKGMSNPFPPTITHLGHRKELCFISRLKAAYVSWAVVQAVFLSACEQPRAVVYSQALHEIAQAPERSLAACQQIDHPEDKADCLFWGARHLLEADKPEAAKELCSLLTEIPAFECAFLLAEHSSDAGYCVKAGPFEFDCQIHLLHQKLMRTPNTDKKALITSVGLDPEAREPWTVVHRFVLGEGPLDLGKCAGLPHLTDCHEAGQGLFHDRLRMMRDRKLLSCAPSDWPDRFQFVSHPKLDPILDAYLEDLSCSG